MQEDLVKGSNIYLCVKARVQVHFKGNNTIKNLLVIPKDTDSIINKGGVIYRYKCDHP